MPSGYEKSGDYGGPPPTDWGIVALAVIAAALIVVAAWLFLTGEAGGRELRPRRQPAHAAGVARIARLP